MTTDQRAHAYARRRKPDLSESASEGPDRARPRGIGALAHARGRLGVALSLLLVLSAAASPLYGEPPPAGANAICPVDGDEAKARFAVEHAGETVYLCCGRCARTFRQNPDRYVALAADLPRVGEPAGHDDGHDHDHDQEHEHEHDRDHPAADVAAPDVHAHDHDEASWLERFGHWLGHFHVVTVHLPIGLLIGAAAAEWLAVSMRRDWLSDAARFCVWAGAIGAVVAVPLGWLLLGGDTALDDTITAVHRWLGTAAFFYVLALVAVMETARRTARPGWMWTYRVLLLGGAVLIGVTGHFGGMMVHGADYLAW